VVFLGDSITQGWAGEGLAVWEEHFAPLHAVNLGIGGDEVRRGLPGVWRYRRHFFFTEIQYESP
jgi:hypothetical protein